MKRLCCKKKNNDRDNAMATRTSKKKIVLVNKTTTLHVQHSFLYEYGVKLPDFTFHGARKQAMTIFFSF